MEEKKFSVYCHVTPNNKRYIGLTRDIPKYRWNNGKGYKGCTLFYKAIQKYGWDNIEHKVLIHGLTKEQARRWETKLIMYFKTNDPKYGYNLTSGGETNEYNDKAKKNISEGIKKRVERSGSYHPTRKVICLETKEVFNSIKEVGEKYNININNISSVCSHKRNMVNNLHFLYFEEYEKLSIKDILTYTNKKRKTNSKKIMCLNTGVVYNSLTEASIKLNIKISNLSKVCNGKRNMVGGLKFIFI